MNISSDTKYFIAFQFLSILQLKLYRSTPYKLRRPQYKNTYEHRIA